MVARAEKSWRNASEVGRMAVTKGDSRGGAGSDPRGSAGGRGKVPESSLAFPAERTHPKPSVHPWENLGSYTAVASRGAEFPSVSPSSRSRDASPTKRAGEILSTASGVSLEGPRRGEVVEGSSDAARRCAAPASPPLQSGLGARFSSPISEFCPPGCDSSEGCSYRVSKSGEIHHSEEQIAFAGSFSLGEMFEHEIRSRGKFAFQGKNSSKSAAGRFISSYTNSLRRENENQKLHAESQRSFLQNLNRVEREEQSLNRGEREKQSSGVSGAGQEIARPVYPFGTCVDDVYQNHSWTNQEGGWFWVPKATALIAIENDLGFPVTAAEIRRFRPWSRRVVKAAAKRVDERSFAVVVKQGAMERPQEQASPWTRLGSRGGSGRQEDSREWRGEEDRRASDNYSRGEDRSRPYYPRGDFRQGGGSSVGGEAQRKEYKFGFGVHMLVTTIDQSSGMREIEGVTLQGQG